MVAMNKTNDPHKSINVNFISMGSLVVQRYSINM